MELSPTGQSRVRGYLFVLERSLRTFLSPAQVDDALRELQSHISDRVADAEPVPDEKAALERILNHLGSPLTVARAYSAEMTAEEAVVTGRVVAVARSLLHLGAAGVKGFFMAILLFIGYSTGIAITALAPLKVIAPANVGIVVVGGVPVTLGAVFPVPEDAVVVGGYWLVPVMLAVGGGILLITHRSARAMLRRFLEGKRARVD
jgi:uncharacterized membrane protein